MSKFLLGTIFSVLISVTQVFAKTTEGTLTLEGLRIFISLTQSDPQLAQRLDSNIANSLSQILQDLERPEHIDFFNQILKHQNIIQFIFARNRSGKFQAAQVLRQLYDAYETRDSQLLSSKLSQLRNTEQVSLVKEIFAMLPLEEATLMKIADEKTNSPQLSKWRGVIRELIEYSHSANRALRIEVTQAFGEVSSAKNFKSADSRFQWTEYFNQVWSEVHPSQPNHVRSCYRMLLSP